MLRECCCVIAGCVVGVYVYNEFKHFEYENIIYFDPKTRNVCVNLKANSSTNVTYVCCPDVIVDQQKIIKWSKYRVKHPFVGALLWKLWGLPAADVYKL